MQWRAYERVAGPITVHERVDAAAAQICWVLIRALGGDQMEELSVDDFLPQWGRTPAPVAAPAPQSAESMIATVRSIQSRRRKRKA